MIEHYSYPDGWREHSPTGLMSTIGPLVSKKQNNSWLYGLLIRDIHLNPAGVAHGGTISTLMDHAFSAVCWSATNKRPCVTIQLGINFLEPAYPDDFLVVNSQITRQTHSLLFVTGQINMADRIIANGQAILKVLGSASPNDE